MAEKLGHALLRRATAGLSQVQIAEALECSPPNVSQLLSGKQGLSDERRILARDKFRVPIEAWSLPHDASLPDAADDAPANDTSQDERAHPGDLSTVDTFTALTRTLESPPTPEAA
jgi:transcriptional regulator with XRE-family HTH domain